MPPLAEWRARFWRRRWWIAAATLIVAVRAALPLVLRSVVESQASTALHARVEVGDVDLRLWRGGVALEDVAVRAADAPTPPAGPTLGPGDGAAPAFSEYSPMIAFKRFAIELRYLPLFRKTIQLRDVELASPRVALDHLGKGNLNVMALVPSSEVAVEAGATPADVSPTPSATASPGADAEGSGWSFGLDQFVLRDGRLRFRDLALEGSEPVELGIDEARVDEIALAPGVYGEPARIHLKLGVDEGAIDVNARVTLAGGEATVVTDIDANRMPLRRARLYIPNVGWSDLAGELDLALTYELEPKKKNQLGGTLALRDVAVTVPNLEEVAISWKSLTANIETVDLLGARAAVTDVALDGALVTVRAVGGDPLPWLAETSGTQEPTPAESPSPSASPSPPADDAGKAPPKPWDWSVAKVTISDSKVRVLSDQPPVAVGVALDANGLGSADDAVAHAALSLAFEPGSVALEGDFRIDQPAFGGTLRIADLSLPPLVALSGALPPEAISSAKLRTDLAIAAGLPAKGEEAPVDRLLVSGTIGLDDVSAVPPSTDRIEVKLKGLDLAIERASIPGVIPLGSAAAADSTLALAANLSLADPRVTLGTDRPVRLSAGGLVLKVPSLDVPASLAKLAPPAGAIPVVGAALNLELVDPHVGLADSTTVEAHRVALDLAGVQLPVSNASAGPGAPPAKVSVKLDLDQPLVTTAEGKELNAGAESIALNLTDVVVPGFVAGASLAAAGEPIRAGATLAITKPHVTTAEGKDIDAGAESIALTLIDAVVPGFVAGAPPAAAAGEPIRAGATLAITKLRATTAEGKELNAGAESFTLDLTDVVVPASFVRATSAPAAEPIRAGAALAIVKPHVTRGDGKEFAIDAASIRVPLNELSLPGETGSPAEALPDQAAKSIRAVFGEVRVEEPVIVVTRTKDGIVLPGLVPAGAATPPPPPSPSAPFAVDVQLAQVQVQRGRLSFTDHAVDPTFATRITPIEIDARNVRYPGPVVEPLKVELHTEPDGEIEVSGKLSPDASTLVLSIKRWPLVPYNPYATTYSAYDIGDGALSLELKATSKEGKVDIHNDLKLHQLDLSGAEDESGFQKRYGISLSMALALLRDTHGDIGLGIPLQIDRNSKTNVDLPRVFRSAFRQALAGAIQSPLKLLGVGGGKKKVSMAPAPIAFRRGRAKPTKAGEASTNRLADFLTARPAVGLQLSSAPTVSDVRWLREQALAAKWKEENFFRRSLGFVTARGPRERVRAYLKARKKDKPAKLSDEDKATLDEWLAEVPPPTPDELRALAAARLAAVRDSLGKRGIDAARIALVDPSGEPAEGKPVALFNLRAAEEAVVQ